MSRLFIAFFLCIIFIANTSFYKRPVGTTYSIVITKSAYELSVYDNNGWLVTYPVVFGKSDLQDKMYQGDKETPEGYYKIASKRKHEKWHRMMLLDYPTHDDSVKFYERRSKGLLPVNAQLGDGIGIHGTWQHEGYAVDQFQNWTDGCISMRNENVDELYDMVPVGTIVVIKK
jgi:murein L,D-transpeptidase YafK